MSEAAWTGSRALQRRCAVERWLREEVVATYDAVKARPERVVSTQEVAGRMRARHEARLKRGA